MEERETAPASTCRRCDGCRRTPPGPPGPVSSPSSTGTPASATWFRTPDPTALRGASPDTAVSHTAVAVALCAPVPTPTEEAGPLGPAASEAPPGTSDELPTTLVNPRRWTEATRVTTQVVVVLVLLGLTVGTVLGTSPGPSRAAGLEYGARTTRGTVPGGTVPTVEPVQLGMWRGGAGNSCSGTAIAGTRYVVTAAHCFKHDGITEVAATWFGRPLTVTRWAADPRFQDINRDNRYDLAVVEVTEPLAGPGTASLWTGQPLVGPREMWAWQYGTETVPDRQVHCAVTEAAVGTDHGAITVPCSFRPGASGSGMVRTDATGQPVLVAVLSAYVPHTTENWYAPVAELTTVLRMLTRYAPAAG